MTPATTTHAACPTAASGHVAVRTRRLGAALLGASAGAWLLWFGWRLLRLSESPIEWIELALELVGATCGVVVGAAMLAAERPRAVYSDRIDGGDVYRYAFGVADVVGRTRAEDLHREVRSAVRSATRSGRQAWRRPLPDFAMGAVLLDGSRRLASVAVLTLALLLGQRPMPMPGLAAGLVVTSAVALGSCAHVLLSGGRIRFGDRLRWSFGSLGEIVVRDDVAGVAPRRWVGTVAVIVVLNLAIALRGISDRWTHGLPAMDVGDRRVAILAALALVLIGLYALSTIAPPQLDNAHLVARRLEERTARQTVLAAAIAVGLIGLFAGVLPSGDVSGDGVGDLTPDGARDSRRIEAPHEPRLDEAAGG